MNRPPYKVLILCTGNSARSVIGEFLLRQKGKGRFEAFSAGSHPTGKVNPLAIWVLKDRYDIDASGARSKSWDEFKDVNFDFVITVCDNAAGETCPVWPGMPITAHWGIPDPAAVEGTEIEKKAAFTQAFKAMDRRIKLFLSLPIASIDQMRIKEHLDAIGKTDDAL